MKLTAREITAFVEQNREEAIRCLIEAVQTPSITGNELAMSKVLTRWMEQNGLQVEQLAEVENRPNLLAEWHGSKTGKRFVFNGHMDVFPPDPEDPGPFGPWAGRISDGYLYGRGAADMKGGDCGALMAVVFLKRMGFDPCGSVLLSYTVDEEAGGEHGVKYLLKKNKLNGDFGICMDCSAGKILIAHGGIVRATCTYFGEPQHSSKRYPGENALRKAIHAVTELYKIDDRLAQVYPKDFDQPCLNITVMHAGTVGNINPASASFIIDRRLIPGEDRIVALQEIVDVLEGLKAENPDYEYQLEVTSDRPFLSIAEDDPFIQLLARSQQEVLGEIGVTHKRGGGSDAANIQESTGMPIPNYAIAEDLGEGGSGKPNERISVQGYLDFIKVYMMAVVNALGET